MSLRLSKCHMVRNHMSRLIYIYSVSIAQMDSPSSTVSNYAGGEAVGGSWTDKIMDVKSSTTTKTNDGDCADDDEWVSGIDIIWTSTQENLSLDTFQ